MDQITAEQIVASIQSGGIYVLLINLTAFLSGLIYHVVKRCKQNNISFIQYWRGHPIRSSMSVGALVATFIGLAATASPIYTFFISGYATNSIVNKTPVKK